MACTPWRGRLGWALLMLVAGGHVQQTSAAISLRMPVIPWFSVLRGGYVDLVTKQPVTTTFTAAEAGPMPAAAQGNFQQQNSLLNPAPRPTSRTIFPITLPSLDYWERCFKETDPLSALITKCNYQETFTTCSQLGLMGYLPKGVQSFEASKLTGSFNIPTGCTAGSLGVSYDKLFRLTFNSPQVPILAVITKDPIGSMVSYFGTGTTQGRIKHRLATKAEFCYSPTLSEISVSKSAIYSTGMQPGTAAWMFSKSVDLAGPYNANHAMMFNGDSVDATWTLAAQKTGTDVNYQGVVSGQISINNPTPALITVNSIVDQITGGPTATVSCPVGTPFTVPACSFATCQYTAYYPTAPPPGTYTSAAQVSFQVLGSQGYPSTTQGTAAFNVGSVASLAALATSAGTIPQGSAMVTDTNSPQKSYMFSGPGSQSFTTTLTCSSAAPAGPVTQAATLTGANGQQITQSATVQKQCYDLQVSVATKAAPYVGRWGWSVTKTASPASLTLKPDSRVYEGSSSSQLGADYADTTTGDVMYTVTYTRSAPAGFVDGKPAFEAAGDVYVGNSAPINAKLQGVYVSITNSRPGGQPYVTQATCPVLTVPAGQRITCSWKANPTFNPTGQPVRATARYLNTRNGEPSGSTTDFNSAPVTIGGAGATSGPATSAAEAGPAAQRSATFGGYRGLLQTWGGGARGRGRPTVGVIPEMEAGALPSPTLGFLPELEPAVATTMYAVDGSPMVVPNGVANGSAVIVSGDTFGLNGVPALAAAQGHAVLLPGLMNSAGVFVNGVNEAGPGGAAAQLTGLQDECAEVSDTFVLDDGSVKGVLISGTQPTGRICASTTFTYTMRYGPYADCLVRKAVNAATFQTIDTQTAGSDQADVSIKVEGCVNPAALKIQPTRVRTSALGGYTWSVTKTADREDLALGQDATATVTYTVAYKRSGAKAGSMLNADAVVTNPTAYPIPLESATYTATSMCGGAAKTTSGPVSCDALQVPPKGKVACRVAATVPCPGNGAYTIVLVAGGGYTVTSMPTPFAFNATQLAAASSSSQCAVVRDTFKTGEGRVGGALVSGTRPNGKLCGSKTFTYAVKFGPYTKCGSFKAVNVASLASNSTTRTASATATLPISVVGCSLYTDMVRTQDCVKNTTYWPKCNLDADPKCANGWKLLPGGKGKGTLFFPKPNQRTTRTYNTMLTVPAPVNLTASKKAYINAAKQFVAAQLNFLSGARLPTAQLQGAYDGLSSFLTSASEGTTLPKDKLADVVAKTALLARYNNGTLPTNYGAPKRCSK